MAPREISQDISAPSKPRLCSTSVIEERTETVSTRGLARQELSTFSKNHLLEVAGMTSESGVLGEQVLEDDLV